MCYKNFKFKPFCTYIFTYSLVTYQKFCFVHRKYNIYIIECAHSHIVVVIGLIRGVQLDLVLPQLLLLPDGLPG